MKYNHAIKRYLKAKTPRGLELAMLRNNIQRGMFFVYEHIQQANDGNWYAWYLDEKNDPMKAVEELNDASEG